MNALAKLLAGLGLLLLGIAAVTYVYYDVVEKKQARADAEAVGEFFGELLSGDQENQE